jgi:hypothetical protein
MSVDDLVNIFVRELSLSIVIRRNALEIYISCHDTDCLLDIDAKAVACLLIAIQELSKEPFEEVIKYILVFSRHMGISSPKIISYFNDFSFIRRHEC